MLFRSLTGSTRLGPERFRKPEIQDFGFPLRGDLDVRRFEIAVDDSPLVRSLQCFRDALEEREYLPHGFGNFQPGRVDDENER